MSDLIVTHDANGLVHSVEKVEATTKRCLSCKRDLAMSAFVEDNRTADHLSHTCKSCRSKGIITREDAKAGKTVSTWSMGMNAQANKGLVSAEKARELLNPKPESTEQKVMTVLQLIIESLNKDEREILVRMLQALGGGWRTT